ncbi:putative magnesium transporter NIPA6 [Citrus sinensis]|uniref:Magnesium transporter NIPA6 n=1 Tax=Citrus sinensis TaxID=2711 RepID=A0ACB8IIH2_CITSI|nr:putative magnesium transporter NIPA6 [Citrus sinensis]
MGLSENSKGLILAVASSAFIGSSFILKKKGLKRAGASGTRAGVGGYTYLLEPLWWAGMVTMIVGEVANFVAYVYAPAVLVTPLGALSIIISAVLAHFMLKERLQKMGILGCITCIVGSVVIVIHAPQEHTPNSVQEIWALATQPDFLIYVAATVSVVLALVLHFEPRCGQTNILVYLGICSLMGSLTVVSIKAIGIAIKLTLDGISQIAYPQTWFFLTVAAVCVVTQLNYLNKALDTFNAAIVSPVYYVMFTTLTIIASAIMFKDWSGQDVSGIASEICGFITVLSGTIILHATREHEQTTAPVSLKMDLKNEDDPPLFEQHCYRANKSWRSEEPLVFLDNADFNSER